MKKYKGKFLKIVFFVIFVGLFLNSVAFAANYRQPSYITNIYFFNKPVKEGDTVHPAKVINQIQANNPKVKVNVKMNLVGDKGSHLLEVDILDKEARTISNVLKFDPWVASKDNELFTVNTWVGGNLPEGGIFLKVYDTLGSGNKTVIGVFRIMTFK